MTRRAAHLGIVKTRAPLAAAAVGAALVAALTGCSTPAPAPTYSPTAADVACTALMTTDTTQRQARVDAKSPDMAASAKELDQVLSQCADSPSPAVQMQYAAFVELYSWDLAGGSPAPTAIPTPKPTGTPSPTSPK